ncbi:unnamed protein product [Boreogadus saida]
MGLFARGPAARLAGQLGGFRANICSALVLYGTSSAHRAPPLGFTRQAVARPGRETTRRNISHRAPFPVGEAVERNGCRQSHVIGVKLDDK